MLTDNTKEKKKTKEYNIKPTLKHKKVLKNLVENGGNKYKAIKDAGYSEAVATTPQKVTESKGFQRLVAKYLDDDFVLSALHDDIKAKPKQRVQELQLASKIKGWLKDSRESDKTLILITTGESATRYKLDNN